jgi:ATP-dependent helicase/nuclease subunit A
MMNRIPKPEGATWTDEQWEAITARGQNILVAAAAGSGKTAVLVERIIQRITESNSPVDVDRLLIVTFTNASAAEMKKRIGEAIEKELQKEPNSLFLRRQLTLLNRASISTLHSFCMEVLRRYYYKLDLDPKFRIAEDTEAVLLREEVLEELFEEQYGKENNEAFYQLVDRFSSDRSDQELQNRVLQLYDFSRSHPFPGKWLEEMAFKYGSRDGQGGVLEDHTDLEGEWTSEVLADIALQLEGLHDLLQQGLALTREPAGPAPYAENLEEDLQLINNLCRACKDSWEATYINFQELKHGRLKPCKGDEYDKFLQEKVKAIRDQVKKHLGNLKTELFERPLVEYMEDIRQMAPMMHTLVDMVNAFQSKYTQLKQQKGLVDFADLEHYCLAVLQHPDSTVEKLQPSEAALDYRKKFEEVLVDEYQDTNLVQESILKLVTRGDTSNGNLFMVGDVKQSIYRFRLADPGLFLHKYKTFIPSTLQNAEDELEHNGLRIDLARNFRSREEVLHGTNFLFKQVMNETVGEIEYDQDAELKVGANYPTSDQMQVELLLIDRQEGNASSDQGAYASSDEEDDVGNGDDGEGNGSDSVDHAELETVQLEARLMGQKIKTLIGNEDQAPFQVYDQKYSLRRPIQYRDIVILLRATSSWAPTIIEELKQQGIPAYAELSTGYFEATEVAVMMSLLKIIDNPFQDIPLASVLRSPIVGLNEDEMSQIRIHQQRGSYYEALRDFVGHLDQDENPKLFHKLNQFSTSMEQWRTRARQGSLSDLIWQIYRETGYFDFIAGMPGGQQRQANLRALYDRARQYESTSFRGLFRFLRFIERMQEKGRDLGAARALGEQEDVVRVMTIHKSKGLEFPVVFMAGVSKQFNMQDVNSKFLLHKELGFGTKFIDSERRITYPTLPQLTIKRRLRMETLAEEMRVLYVALTRAKEKLFLIGTVKDGQKKIEHWSQHLNHPDWILGDYDRAKGMCYLDWIAPALVRHQDATVLRQTNDVSHLSEERKIWGNQEVSEHPSSWAITFIAPQSLQSQSREQEPLNQSIQQAIMQGQPVGRLSENLTYVNDALSWKYDHPAAQEHMAKQSVTELKRQKDWLSQEGSIQISHLNHQVRTPIVDRPLFLQSKKLTAAERGTAMHMVMQHLPLTETMTLEEIRNHVYGMEEAELLTKEQAKEIDHGTISKLLKSELAQRMFQAKQIHREVPFSMGLSAIEVFPDWQKDEQETVLVQGVIDCVFEEEDGLVLIDYKTDAITNRYTGGFEEAKPIMIDRYTIQLSLYARAIEQIWKKSIKEKHLYFFDGGHLLEIEQVKI